MKYLVSIRGHSFYPQRLSKFGDIPLTLRDYQNSGTFLLPSETDPIVEVCPHSLSGCPHSLSGCPHSLSVRPHSYVKAILCLLSFLSKARRRLPHTYNRGCLLLPLQLHRTSHSLKCQARILHQDVYFQQEPFFPKHC